jgi:hypothetical protein
MRVLILEKETSLKDAMLLDFVLDVRSKTEITCICNTLLQLSNPYIH